jgi:hypothetical protein
MHVLARLAPTLTEYVPGRHRVQTVKPAESVYEPARQEVHAPLDEPPEAAEYVPVEQGVHV